MVGETGIWKVGYLVAVLAILGIGFIGTASALDLGDPDISVKILAPDEFMPDSTYFIGIKYIVNEVSLFDEPASYPEIFFDAGSAEIVANLSGRFDATNTTYTCTFNSDEEIAEERNETVVVIIKTGSSGSVDLQVTAKAHDDDDYDDIVTVTDSVSVSIEEGHPNSAEYFKELAEQRKMLFERYLYLVNETLLSQSEMETISDEGMQTALFKITSASYELALDEAIGSAAGAFIDPLVGVEGAYDYMDYTNSMTNGFDGNPLLAAVNWMFGWCDWILGQIFLTWNIQSSFDGTGSLTPDEPLNQYISLIDEEITCWETGDFEGLKSVLDGEKEVWNDHPRYFRVSNSGRIGDSEMYSEDTKNYVKILYQSVGDAMNSDHSLITGYIEPAIAAPAPRFVSMPGANVDLGSGEEYDFVFRIENDGGTANDSYFSLSISEGLEITGYSSDKSNGEFTIYHKDKLIWYHDEYQIPAKYTLLDWYRPWLGAGEAQTLTVTIKGTADGDQWIKYRLAFDPKLDEMSFVRNPTSGELDQQGWHTYGIDVTVDDVANGRPSADFSFSVDEMSVSFASLATDPDSDSLSYYWDFDDGSSSTAESPAHEYESGGDYDVTLTVTDTKGLSDYETKRVHVNEKPEADFSYYAIGTEVMFTSTSTDDGSIVSWDWDFGDYDAGAGEVVSHEYSSAGSYDVMLTVTDDGGKSDSDTVAVTVTANAAPVADAGCDQSVVSSAVVTLDGSGSSDSDGTIEYYEWQEGGAVLGNGAILETVFAQGVHEITLYVVDDGGKVGEDVVWVAVTRGGGCGTLVNGTISTDTTWAVAGSPYIVTDEGLTVNDDVTLALEPGVVVKFESANAGIYVKGTLNASGTPDNEIIFTSLKDDSYGGDTNGDGGVTSPKPGDWGYLRCYGSSFNDGIGIFDHCILRYGGNSSYYPANVYSHASNSFSFNNSVSEYSERNGIYSYSSNPVISNSTFNGNGIHGLYTLIGSPIVTNNTFNHNSDHGFCSDGSTLSVTNNTFTNNTNYATYLSGITITSFRDNKGSENGINGLGVSGTVLTSQTWGQSSPYITLNTGVTVNDDVTLALEPGVVVKFESANAGIYVKGTLNASGTPDNEIIFTSLKDDSYGGDTNGDGGVTSPKPGDWGYLRCYGSSFNDGIGIFDHCILRYGGNSSYYPANVYSHASNSFSFNNSVSEYSERNGIYSYSSNPVISNSTIRNSSSNGIYVASASTPYIRYTNMYNNFLYNIYNAQSSEIIAPNNWWGTTDTDAINDSIYDHYDTPSYGTVYYTPYLNAPAGTTDTTPPTLTITSPAPNTTTHTPTITIAGTASDTSGIASVTVNGEPANGTLDWSANVTLTEGENLITVVATDGKGLNTTKTIMVYRIESFTFVHITDVHIGYWPSDDTYYSEFLLSIERFTDTLQATKTHNPEFILSPGDLVEYSEEDFFNAYMGISKSLDIPLYNTPGNHDRRGWDPRDNVGLTAYDEIIKNPADIKPLNDGYRDYYFDRYGYRFIGLDSGADYNVSLPPFLESSNVSTLASYDDFYDSSPEGDGLKEIQLTGLSEMDSEMPKIIFMHHPAVSDSDDESATWSSEPPVTNNCPPEYGGNDACIAFNRCGFIDYCINNNTDLVLTGHTHWDYVKTVFNEPKTHKTWFIQTRSATKDPGPYNYHGYRVIKITDEGIIPHMSEMTEDTLRSIERYTYSAPSNLLDHIRIYAYVISGSNVTGILPDDTVKREIPDSYYTGVLDELPQIIRCYNEKPDKFKFGLKLLPADTSDTTSQKAIEEASTNFNIIMKHQTENMTATYIYEDVTFGTSENATAIVDLDPANVNYTMEIDYDGDGIIDDTTDPTHITINYAPEISITTPTGEERGNVTIPYNLKDAESDDCTIIAQYSLNNITWLDAGVGEGGDGMINLASAPAGVDHAFVWASGIDIPQTNATVYFRIRPYDGDLAGDYATTGAFSVDNRVRGDLNHDGILTPTDAAIALEIAAGSRRPCDAAMLDAADVSGDGCVTSLDALMILQGCG